MISSYSKDLKNPFVVFLYCQLLKKKRDEDSKESAGRCAPKVKQILN